MTDTYSAAAAARILGLSERRVRQLCADEVLTVTSGKPLRIEQESVHQLRKQRQQAAPAADSPGLLTMDQVVELASKLAAEMQQKALESAERYAQQQQEAHDRIQQALADELAASRAEAAQLRAQLDARPTIPSPVDAVRGLLRWRP